MAWLAARGRGLPALKVKTPGNKKGNPTFGARGGKDQDVPGPGWCKGRGFAFGSALSMK